MENQKIEIRPQTGYQEHFLSSSADIIIGGGSAGSGKTYALLLEAARYLKIKEFRGVIFRRISPQITSAGGLWDTSVDLFSVLQCKPKESVLTWDYPFGGRLKFNHLEYEKNKFDHQGAQYDFIGFDELTQFSQTQFFFLLSRNRGRANIKPLIRATCNPDPDSWVAKLIEWWIDQETGFPIPERDGVIRYFMKDQNNYIWGNSVEEVAKKAFYILKEEKLKDLDIKDLVKSITFIKGSVYENRALLSKTPEYIGNLLAQDPETKSRLLDGNWKLTPDDMCIFEYDRINDLFDYKLSDEIKNQITPAKRFITCDPARFGRDFAVIKVWYDKHVEKIYVWRISALDFLHNEIEKIRIEERIAKSNVAIDSDGLGAGLLDAGKYKSYSAGSSPIKLKKINANYGNLKAQCAYRMAERVNNGEISITDFNIYVDGRKTPNVLIGNKLHSVIDLIKQDLRSFKRTKDFEGKKRVIPKEEQKVILGGRSPDFGDSFIMRELFELRIVTSLTPMFF